MAKKKKKNSKRGLQMQKRKKQPKIELDLQSFGNVSPEQKEFAEAYFSDMSGDLEPLTDELIDELVESMSMPREDLIQMRDMGMHYSRKRGSFWEA